VVRPARARSRIDHELQVRATVSFQRAGSLTLGFCLTTVAHPVGLMSRTVWVRGRSRRNVTRADVGPKLERSPTDRSSAATALPHRPPFSMRRLISARALRRPLATITISATSSAACGLQDRAQNRASPADLSCRSKYLDRSFTRFAFFTDFSVTLNSPFPPSAGTAGNSSGRSGQREELLLLHLAESHNRHGAKRRRGHQPLSQCRRTTGSCPQNP